jgi:hypothetical protein
MEPPHSPTEKSAESFRGVGIVLLQQQLSLEPMRLSLIAAVFMDHLYVEASK